MTVPDEPRFLTLPKRRRTAPDQLKIALAGAEVAVRLRRNASARRYILRVDSKTREAVMTLPKRGSIREAEAFLRRSRSWLEKRLAELPPHCPIVDGGVIPLRGGDCRIVHRGGRGTAELREGFGMPELHVAGAPEHLARRAVDWLKREAGEDLRRAVAIHADRLGVKPKSVRLRDTVSRWGSCSADGALSFSWRLIMAPPFVLDYLAAHEVAHLLVMDHSRRFWRILGSTCDRVSEAEAWLKRNGQDLHAIGAPPQPVAADQADAALALR